jgi:transposase InsO family protein
MTKAPFKKVNERATILLTLVHADVCSPIGTSARGGYSYFIIFNDDFIRYVYLFLMRHRSESLKRFKEFQNEVENQLEKKIKALRSDHDGEYLSIKFNDHLKQCGIIPQLTLLGTPQWNDVSERRNRTLLDMVRSMMSRAELPFPFRICSWDCYFYPE